MNLLVELEAQQRVRDLHAEAARRRRLGAARPRIRHARSEAARAWAATQLVRTAQRLHADAARGGPRLVGPAPGPPA